MVAILEQSKSPSQYKVYLGSRSSKNTSYSMDKACEVLKRISQLIGMCNII